MTPAPAPVLQLVTEPDHERDAVLVGEELRRASRRMAVAHGHLALMARDIAATHPALARQLAELGEGLRIASAEAADLVGA